MTPVHPIDVEELRRLRRLLAALLSGGLKMEQITPQLFHEWDDDVAALYSGAIRALPALLAERDEFLSVLDDVSECLSHYEDASCEDGERFTPNRAMSMRQVVDDLRAKHAKDPRP